MAKDVTIYQKSTSYHYSSVDHIQTKGLDEESYVQCTVLDMTGLVRRSEVDDRIPRPEPEPESEEEPETAE